MISRIIPKLLKWTIVSTLKLNYKFFWNGNFNNKWSFNKLIINSKYFSSQLPKFEKLAMPSLSPTMEKGKIIKWNKK